MIPKVLHDMVGVTVEADADTVAALTDAAASLFFDCGGVVTWELFTALSPAERAAFARARAGMLRRAGAILLEEISAGLGRDIADTRIEDLATAAAKAAAARLERTVEAAP